MTDTAVADPVVETADTPEVAAAEPVAAAPPAADAGTPQAETPPAAPAAEADWRKLMAGDDAKALKKLERYASPADFLKARDELELKLRDTNTVKIPGKDATEEDVAAFRKALGVPDKPDGYKITATPPEGVELGSYDQGVLTSMVERLHAAGASPDLVNAAHQFYYDQTVTALQVREQAAEERRKETEALLRAEFRGDFETNLKIAKTAMSDAFGLHGDAINEVFNQRMEDGTKLGDDPRFIRAFVRLGRERLEDPMFVETLRTPGVGKSPDDVIREIMALRSSQPKEYERRQGELDAAYSRREALQARN